MMMLRQLSFALTDLALHSAKDPDIKAIEKEVAAKTAVLPPLEEDRFLCSFSHIFAGGYAAGYYSYKWAEVLSADAFEAFEEAGLEDPEALAQTGARFRDTVLGLGGSRHPAEIFKAFRGRSPSPKALLRHHGLLKA
jgi:oligopeptidase A